MKNVLYCYRVGDKVSCWFRRADKFDDELSDFEAFRNVKGFDDIVIVSPEGKWIITAESFDKIDSFPDWCPALEVVNSERV